MFDTKSDYALNKKEQDAIVCKSVDGVHIRLTREDFASEEEFLRWKAWSDSDYHDTEKVGRGFYDKCISLNDALDSTGLSVEDILMAPVLEAERAQRKAALILEIRDSLSEKQYRRLRLYHLDGLSEKEIAQLEGVGQQRISNSLVSGAKVLKKIFKKFLRG